MFEKIKCAINIKKVEKFYKGCRIMSELTNDEKLMNEVLEGEKRLDKLKHNYITNRKMAKSFNESCKDVYR